MNSRQKAHQHQLQRGIPGVGDLAQPFILQNLELYNWGPFGGRHCAHIDARGTAIIGPTGSGKTTLVDALMTLLTALPRYNLASTGGHESDRDLISYVRGVTGAGNESGDNSHISRSSKTVSGIAAEFGNQTQQRIQLAAILWVDSASFAASDRKDLWLINERDDQALQNWLLLHNEGGARALKQFVRETPGLRVFDTKKAYLAEVRQFFEVGENAFALLNRASGLKQLNSVDDIFRELVLDDYSTFGRAAEVTQEFDDLAAIHAELETARRQLLALQPIQIQQQKHDKVDRKLQVLRKLLKLLPVYFAIQAQSLWRQRVQALDAENQSCKASIDTVERQHAARVLEADTLKQVYLEMGGNTIEQLEEQIATQQELTRERQRNADDYARLAVSLNIDPDLTEAAFLHSKQAATEQIGALQNQTDEQRDAVYKIGAEKAELQKHTRELGEEIDKIKARPGSNIPSRFQDFRADLAAALGVDDPALPFVAELIEVKAEQQNWRGAIERALGGHRLRVLVPATSMVAALQWVNSRDNKLHVRLLEAKVQVQQSNFMGDGFTRKLNFKPHALREPLKSFLASIDRHCVPSSEALRTMAHAMTEQGLMSGTPGRFEKQDQQALNQGWLTGFDNKDSLDAVRQQLAEQQSRQANVETQWQARSREMRELEQRQNQLQLLVSLEFERIDLPAAQQKLELLNQRLATLTRAGSNVAKAQADYKAVESIITALDGERRDLLGKSGRLEEKWRTANASHQQAVELVGDGLNDEQLGFAEQHLADVLPSSIDQLAVQERQVRDRLEGLRDKQASRLDDISKTMVRLMHRAREVDTGALNEAGTDLRDTPVYLERMQVLTEEALPEKLQRFLAYLNRSSDQGVTQLLADIDNEVGIIEDRINDLNMTLRRVDFQRDRYLQLEPRRIVHDLLSTLQKAQRHLRAAALADDDGESHYRALETVVTILRDAASNRRTLGSRALLDPRYRLHFAVSVLDRESGALIETRTGSQGGSGGEKEIIASYILTASLSYALCPPGALLPLFGTIVLDEAFSKSSQAVAGRIISALREFGLHPLFVTPNKEMRLLRDHTRSAILVHRKGVQSTLTSLSWEELQAQAKRQLGK